MAEDIIVRLKAEAETAALTKYEAQLGKIADAALKAGKSEAEVHKQLQGIHAKTILDAQRAGKSVGEYLDAVGTKAIKASDGMQKLATEVKKVEQAHAGHGSAISHVTRELGAMAAGYLAVHKVVHTLIDSFEEFAKFDKSLRTIQNATGQTDQQIQALGKSFVDLSRTSGKSAEDILEGFQEIREGAHLTADQAKAMMGTITTGAMAAGTSVTHMSDAMGSLMRNMNVEGGEAIKIMDQMAMANSHLRLNMGQMVSMMPRLTEAFGSMGYAGEEGTAKMLAWVSALRDVSKNSNEAAGAASRMVDQVTGPGIAHALKMPQTELQRVVEHIKDEGGDVMMVVTGMLAERSEMTGKSIEQLLDRLSIRERRYWRVAIEQRQKVAQSEEELTKHSEGLAKKQADNFRKGPQQAIDELTQSWTAFKMKLGESMGKLGVTEGLQSANENLDILIRNFEVAEGYAEVIKNYMKDIFLQGKLLSNSPETEAATKRLRETVRRNADERKAKEQGEAPGGTEQERLDAAFGKVTPKGPKGERVPNWVPNAHKGTFYGGWTGWPGGAPAAPMEGGQAQHFAGGGGFDGDGGRNWQHDLLSDSPMSSNIEDRRTEERATDATRANTVALQRLTDLLEDVEDVRGGLASQLGGDSIPGGGGGGRRGRGAGVAQRFAGGGSDATGYGSGRAGAGTAGGPGGGGMGNLPTMGPGGAPTTNWDSGGGNAAPGNFMNPGGRSEGPGGGGGGEGTGAVTHQGTGGAVPQSLQDQMEYAGRMAGVTTNVAHGMEPGHARHRAGAPSGDVDLFDAADGHKLDARNPADREKMSSYITAARAAGATGIGFGGESGGYMGTSRMHVGGGSEAVWGAGGRSANAPGWVSEAFSKGQRGALSPQQLNQKLAEMRAGGGGGGGNTRTASLGGPGMNDTAWSGGEGGGQGYLVARREQFKKEMDSDPALKSYFAQVIAKEGRPGDEATAVAESVLNRAAASGKSLRGALTGEYARFFGPINRGEVGPISGAADKMYKADIDRAAGGSNLTKGSTDQGMRNEIKGDFATKVDREWFGDWGGGKGMAANRAFRENQQRGFEEANRQGADDETARVAGPGAGGKKFRGVRNLRGDEDAKTSGGWADQIKGEGGGRRNSFSERARSERRSRGGEGGSPAGMPRQASESKRNTFNLDRTQFSRRDRQMDKQAQTALHQASENSHADIGVA